MRKCKNDEGYWRCIGLVWDKPRAHRCYECRRLRRNRLARERYREKQDLAMAIESALRRGERDPFGRRVFGVL